MIDVNELMIGNIGKVINPQYGDNSEFCIYRRHEEDYGNQLGFWNYTEDGMIACYEFEDIEPVLISIESLTKIGFKKSYELRRWNVYNDDYSIIFWFYKNGRIDYRIFGLEMKSIVHDGRHGFCKTIKYIHQLQNLILLLIGKQFKINQDGSTI